MPSGWRGGQGTFVGQLAYEHNSKRQEQLGDRDPLVLDEKPGHQRNPRAMELRSLDEGEQALLAEDVEHELDLLVRKGGVRCSV